MKKALLLILTGAFLALTSSLAFAVGGINLYWNDCSIGGASDRTSTCLSNSGANIMVASFTPPDTMTHFNGMAAVLDLTTNTDPLPVWWQMQTGGCRAGAMTGDYNFVGGPFSCTDVWAGGASGGLSYTYPVPDTSSVATAPPTNHGRIRLVCAVPDVREIDTATEYYVFKVLITNTKTTGVGSCTGCLIKACIVFNSIQLTQPATFFRNFTLINALSSRQITWQGPGGGPDCSAVPVQNRTWGQVKSLYR